MHQRLQPRLVDGDVALLQAPHLVDIHVHAHDMVAHVGQASAADEPYVAGAENGDLHESDSYVVVN